MRRLRERGVSPVTGETLMVAVTIATAAALAIYVAGITTMVGRPVVVFMVEALAAGDNTVQLKLIHNGGSQVSISELKVYAENAVGLMKEAAPVRMKI